MSLSLSNEYQPGKCWAIKRETDRAKGLRVCAAPAGYYALDSKTSNVGPGIIVRVYLCDKHKRNAERHYRVTKVVEQ